MTSTLINTIERPHAMHFYKSLSADKHYFCPCEMTMVSILSILLSVSILRCIVLSGKFKIYKKKQHTIHVRIYYKQYINILTFFFINILFAIVGRIGSAYFYLFFLVNDP